ncbi:DNA polymerase II large subunit [Bienertia sinuspersici]
MEFDDRIGSLVRLIELSPMRNCGLIGSSLGLIGCWRNEAWHNNFNYIEVIAMVEGNYDRTSLVLVS